MELVNVVLNFENGSKTFQSIDEAYEFMTNLNTKQFENELKARLLKFKEKYPFVETIYSMGVGTYYKYESTGKRYEYDVSEYYDITFVDEFSEELFHSLNEVKFFDFKVIDCEEAYNNDWVIKDFVKDNPYAIRYVDTDNDGNEKISYDLSENARKQLSDALFDVPTIPFEVLKNDYDWPERGGGVTYAFFSKVDGKFTVDIGLELGFDPE